MLSLRILSCLALASQASPHPRAPRDADSAAGTPDMSVAMRDFAQKFPQQEFNAFWTKVSDVLGEEKVQFEDQLRENLGDMNRTLAQFKPQMDEEFSMISDMWDAVMNKLTEAGADLAKGTVKDMYNWAKEKAGGMVGDVGGDEVQSKWHKLKDTVMKYWMKITGGDNTGTGESAVSN